MTEAICKCGAPLSEGAAFCSACGQRVAATGSSTSGKGLMLITVIGVIALLIGAIYLLKGAEESADRRLAELEQGADRSEQELRAFEEAMRQVGVADPPPVRTATHDREVILPEFKLLRPGISYEEAESIIGFPGTEISSTDLGGIRTIMFAWTNPTVPT